MAIPTQPIDFSPSKVFLQKLDGSEPPIVGEFPSAPPLPKKVGGERWWTGCDTGPGFGETVLTAEVSVPPEAVAELKRMAQQALLDTLVNVIRKARYIDRYFHVFHLTEEIYRRDSALCHRLHRMNLTRYLRSKCLYPARGIRVTLKSGAVVWRK